MATQRNKRRYPRVRLKPNKWVAIQGGGRTDTHRCTEMGLGGMFLKCSDPLPVGSIVRFVFEVGTQTVRGLAKVRSARAGGMGLAVLSMNTADRAKMRALLQSQTRKRSGN